MRVAREWLHRVAGTFRRRRRDHDLEEELRTHLHLATEDAQRRGGLPCDARAARIRAGGISQTMEQLRDQRGLPWLDDLARDVRHSARALRRSPTFTSVALLTLTLGIGANTAIFSIVNGVILQPLPYPKPEQLVHFTTQFPQAGIMRFYLSYPECIQIRELTRTFSAVGVYTMAEVNITAGEGALRVRSAAVDEYLFDALGVKPAQGRPFQIGETDAVGVDVPGQPSPQPPPIVILSHELWQTAFAGRPVLGQSIEVHGRRREIIGIMPPGVDVADNRTEIWLPLGLTQNNRRGSNHNVYAIGRLNDGVSVQSAQSELDALMQRSTARGDGRHSYFPLGHQYAHLLRMTPLQDEIVGGARRSIWMLQAAVAFVLLVACANLANLLLARAEARRHEFAVRTSLGATRTRLIRQFMTEGVLLSVAGGALGLVVARVGVLALVRAYPNSLPRTSELSVDALVLLFTLGVSIVIGLLFGLALFAHTRLKGMAAALKEGRARGTTGAARHRIRRTLVTGAIALAVVLVVSAGLMIRTVYNLSSIDAGFDRSRLLTFLMTLPNYRYPDPLARAQVFSRVLDRLRAVPGIESTTAMSGLPLNRPLNVSGVTDVEVENFIGRAGDRWHTIEYFQAVMSDYFVTLGIPIVQGRGFESSDVTSPGLVAVVNETLATTLWKDQDPIGRRVRRCPSCPWFTVVGVAKDVKQSGVDQQTRSEFYFFVEETGLLRAFWLFGTGAPGTMNVVVRTALPPAAMARAIEGMVREVDAGVPVVRFREMEDVFAESIGRPRLLAQLLGVFAGLALLLSAIGVYGLLSYMVAERRHEIGLRIALGADRSVLLVHVMKQGLLLTLAGILVGIAGALGASRLFASLLFGVQPTDATTLAAVTTTIVLVAAIACGLPAWRASRLDPNIVLRDD